jgi:hypothetical protein
MNDENFNPPQPPKPEPKKGITINPKYAIAFAVAAFALLMLVILAPSDNKSTPVTTDAPAQTFDPTPVPSVNKYDAYLDHMYNNSGQANTITKAKLIEYGDIVCNALDSGRTIPWIVNYLSTSASTQSDVELFASLVYGSITYICDEYKGDLNLYLNN